MLWVLINTSVKAGFGELVDDFIDLIPCCAWRSTKHHAPAVAECCGRIVCMPCRCVCCLVNLPRLCCGCEYEFVCECCIGGGVGCDCGERCCIEGIIIGNRKQPEKRKTQVERKFSTDEEERVHKCYPRGSHEDNDHSEEPTSQK